MSTVTIVLPSILSKATGGQRYIRVSASTLGDTLDQIKSLYGETLSKKLFEPTGEPKQLLSFYINGRNARLLGFLEAKLDDGDEIVVIPSVSGG